MSTAKTVICPTCGLEVTLSRGRIREHPLKDRPARSKALCPATGQKPAEVPAPDAGDEPAAAPVVMAPTFEQSVLEDQRPAGAWSGSKAIAVDPRLCDPDPMNPRAVVGDVREMADSLIAKGMLQPVIVAPSATKGRYTIIAGHRRIAGAVRANLAEVPALVRSDLVPGTNLSLTAQLVENLHRVELTPMEEAHTYKQLVDLGMKQTEIALAVGCNQGQVSKRLALLKLPEEAQQLVGADGGLDVAAAVELTRLPPAAQKAALADVRAGRDPDRSISQARQAADRKARLDKIQDELEAAGVAIVDFPRGWVWGRDREDRPLSSGVDGENQPYSSMRRIDVAYADHHEAPCHGAAISPDGDVVYVCLDPTRHGYPTAEAELAESDARAMAAHQEHEAARAAEQARVEIRTRAARTAALAKVLKVDMVDHITAWNHARLVHPGDDGWPHAADDGVVDLLLDWAGIAPHGDERIDSPAGADRARAADVAALLGSEGPLRVAYMTVLAEGDVLLRTTRGSYYLDQVRGSTAIVQHYDRLVAHGYELDDGDRALLEPPPPPAPPADESIPDEAAPDDAVAWYAPMPAAVEGGDEPRWVDEGEAAAITDAGLGDRLAYLNGFGGMTAEDAVAAADALVAARDEEETRALEARIAAEDASLVDEVTDDDDASAVADAAHAAVEAPDIVAGERCPASRRDAASYGYDGSSGVCPVCSSTVELTERGRIRDHDVPEREPASS